MPEGTRLLPYDATAIEAAARLIREGSPVAIPTETVYGLAADATRGDAVAAIYAAKERPAFNPLIVHISDLATAARLVWLGEPALRLARAFWPGPLTVIAPLRPDTPIAALATAGLPTVALRVPAHPAMRDLLAACGRPLAAPSANRSGALSPTSAAHVLHALNGRISLIVDGGPSGLGLESTIIAVDADRLRLLRPGPITAERLAEVSGLPVISADPGRIEAPGQLLQHYAPAKPLRLDATDAATDEWLIGFGAINGDVSLSPSGDLAEAASRLFELLHAADAGGRNRIAVAPIPSFGLGLAIRDRLSRASGG